MMASVAKVAMHFCDFPRQTKQKIIPLNDGHMVAKSTNGCMKRSQMVKNKGSDTCEAFGLNPQLQCFLLPIFSSHFFLLS